MSTKPSPVPAPATYVVKVVCINCSFNDALNVPVGTQVRNWTEGIICKNCGCVGTYTKL